MKNYLFFFLFSILFSSISYSQDFLISGTLVDEATKMPLEASTIYAESIKDSVLISYTITDQHGKFELEGKTQLKEVKMYFTYNGYKSLVMNVALKSKVSLGEVQLEQQSQELDEVQVVAERIPIAIKKDTMEFNADSFRTKPDATVEDMLKQLPGVEVDSDGKITVNGKEVNQVLVNGQVFFSNDPKVATKSLPKDIISKIQITDTKTKRQEFTGEAADGENKTINLTIKKDKNKGYMGRVAAGYGTDDRYQLSGLLNHFNDTERISFIAGGNNINNSGFSYDEINDMVGGSRAWDTGLLNNYGNGITTSSNLGTSYANAKKDKFKVDGNYFFAYSDTYNDQRTNRENILPDSRYFTENTSNFNGSSNSNKGSANLEFDIDKTLRVSVQPNLGVNRTNSNNINNTFSRDENGELINSNERVSIDDGFQRNFSNRVTFMKKLDTIGRLVTFSFSNDNSHNKSTSNQQSVRQIYGDDASVQNLDQLSEVDGKRNQYELDASFKQPLVKNLFLNLAYNYSHDQRMNNKEVMDFDVDRGAYTLFNEDLSSNFDFRNEQQSPSLGIQHQGEKLHFRVNASYVLTDLDHTDHLQQSSFSNSYKNLLFSSNLRYTIGKNKRLSARYNSNLNIPNVNQLQPIPNISDPLNIVIGNPDLLPGINHNLNLNYNDYNWKERSGIFLYSGIYIQEDRVSATTETDENFLRTTRFTNVDGNYSGYAGGGYSKQIKRDSVYTLNFNLRPGLNFGQQVSFSNGVELKAKYLNMTPYASVNFNYKELLEVEPSYHISFNNTKYNLDNLDDINYTSQNAGLRLTTYWPKKLIWSNDMGYSYNGNVGPGFKKDALFWNMSLGLQMLKDKATLKMLVYDLLDQNINTRRTTGEDFIQDFEGTVLKRYFMASFSYKFDQFGGSKGQSGGGRRFIGG